MMALATSRGIDEHGFQRNGSSVGCEMGTAQSEERARVLGVQPRGAPASHGPRTVRVAGRRAGDGRRGNVDGHIARTRGETDDAC